MAVSVSPGASTFHVPLQPVKAPREAEHILKIGVELDKEIVFFEDISVEDKHPQYVRLDQQSPLENAVVQLCEKWGFDNSNNFALHYTLSTKDYITENNRHEIKNGSVLALSVSPVRAAQIFVLKLKVDLTSEGRLKVLERVAKQALDPALAQEFIRQEGLDILINMIKNAECLGRCLPLVLQCFCELMEHGFLSWDALDEVFVKTVASHVTGKAKHEDHATLTAALTILELLVSNGANQYPIVSSEVKFEHLIRHLDKSDQSVQQSTVALMNALFSKADNRTKREIARHICDRPVRNALETNVLKREVGTVLTHQLGVLQRLLFNHLYQRAQLPFTSAPHSEQEKLQELRQSAFKRSDEAMSPSTARKHQQADSLKDFKTLGFQTAECPSADLEVVPPGMLALDCMLHYAKRCPESFTRILLENSCQKEVYVCPFAEMSIVLTKLLVDVLKMSEPPSEEGQEFYELFFKKEHPFEDFFAVCIGLLNKTWKEMQAGFEDKDKVMSVVKEQVWRSLSSFPATFEKFQEELNRYNYSEIRQIRQKERERREQSELQAQPILDLREELKVEILDLIRRNRMNILENGQIFPKFSRGTNPKKEKGKFWFWKLSANHKALFYKDCDETSPPVLADTDHKLMIADMRELVSGKMCFQHIKDGSNWGRRSAPSAFVFGIGVDNPDERFNFIAPNEYVYNSWMDGLNALTGKPMESKQKDVDLETLLDLEVRIRLLELEGISIPNVQPTVPPPPPDFDFAYD